jgi:nitrate reductase molybdenum cofactor assembly chaperone NarJ/NarW
MAAPELFKLCSLLLQYPDDALLVAREELVAAAAGLGRGRAARLAREGVELWAAAEPDQLRSRYVETFDFERRNSLYLTYHSYGDRRERGMALIALKQRYEASGLELETDELPDYLPLMLEFRALEPVVGADALIEHREALEVLRGGLEEADSPWARPLAAVCATLPRMTRRQREAAARMAVDGPPDEQVGLEPFAPPEVMPPIGGEGEALPVAGGMEAGP